MQMITLMLCWGSTMLRTNRCAGILIVPVLSFFLAGVAPSIALAQDQRVSAASPSGTYLLGPTDRIRLKVYGEADITGEYEVDSNGFVSIPLAGHVKAAGLTTRQLEKGISSALAKGIVRDPRVNVEIALYRPFYILGEVKKSGEYPYRMGLTVMDAVATAGDSPIAPMRTKCICGGRAQPSKRSMRSIRQSWYFPATMCVSQNDTSELIIFDFV
jgi:protein involved in polysaccharide export with SLBB domain